MSNIELLAPAKDLECGVAAINCGADAVYIGAPKFGAREYAGNSFEDIEALAAHAHKYWAKVYVTVNTLLHDDEIEQAQRLISRLYEIGIDGVIIQDTALLEIDLPPIPIIASTQMHNDTPEKVKFLEQVGIKRVILARELDIDQIKAIKAQTNVELEFFVHGALCVCYSGQCYLSYALGGRSGNRGQCAQPCRKPYRLVDKAGHTLVPETHLLSLKDLNLSDHLAELLQAGVTSFKIEGRLKDKAYVSNVVAYYRAKLDEAMAGMGLVRSSSGKSIVDFTPNPNKTFNRGYTTYFLHGKRAPVGSPETPKMMGERVGRVISASKLGVTLDTNVSLHRGDGICFTDRNGELRGTVINEVRGRTISPEKLDGIERDTIIFRNHDHEFLTQLNKSNPQRLIGVTLTLKDAPDGLLLTALDEDGNTAEYSEPCERVIAEKPDKALVNFEKQLSKSGGTDFECTGVKIELAEMLFVPMSTLNALRRGVLEKLAEARLANRPIEKREVIKNNVPYPETKLSYMGNVLNSQADAFYRRHGVTQIEPAAETGLNLRNRKVMSTRYCIKHQFGKCNKGATKSGEPLMLVDAEGHKLELRFNCKKCEMEVWVKG